MNKPMRIDTLLTGMGYGSRREIESLADTDRLLLDGQPVLDCSTKLALDASTASRLTIDGAALDPLPGMVLMLHKPVGVTCSHKESGKLIYDLLPGRWKRRTPALSSIGRLDKETSGLLLLTDDGLLLHQIISPKRHVAKCYLATLARPLHGNEAALFSQGTLMLEGETTPLKPAELTVLSPTTARLVLHEGRYHQVRRMFAATGNHVQALHRESIGGLHLPETLNAGEHRVLAAEDIAQIFAS